MDKNKNGTLTKSEIKKYLKDPKNAAAKELIRGGQKWSELFDKLDTDKNQLIDEQEFVAYCGSIERIEAAANKAKLVFQAMDKNENGTLTKSEIRKYLKDPKNAAVNRLLTSGLEEFHWADLWKKIDTNNDELFDEAEFVAY